jgi:hypothetical protein
MASVGSYQRCIELVTASPEEVRGDLEDDFHHFQVSIAHDGAQVVGIDGEAVRHPWTTCPGALGPLRDLVGAPLTASAVVLGEHGDPRRTCTHWFDLAGLAIAQASAGREHRRYDVTIPDRDADLRTTATVARDGVELMTWSVGHQVIEGPEPYAGQRLGRGFLAWAEAELDPETAEAAIVLRRACHISMGRLMDLDTYDRASELTDPMLGTCHTFSVGVIETALRVKGSSRPSPGR